MGCIVALFLGGLLALSLVLNRVVVQPTRWMVERINDIASGEGDLTRSLDEQSNDELGEPAHGFILFVHKLNRDTRLGRRAARRLGTHGRGDADDA